jgi:hypothetical protein
VRTIARPHTPAGRRMPGTQATTRRNSRAQAGHSLTHPWRRVTPTRVALSTAELARPHRLPGQRRPATASGSGSVSGLGKAACVGDKA